MGREITIDVREMEAPEPLLLIMETIGDFAPGDRLKVIIDCEPRPLYGILERNGYAHETIPGTISAREISIWKK